MSKQALRDFRKVWLNTYIQQYKRADAKARKDIKRNVYSNIWLTEDEKDKIWEEIVRWGFEKEWEVGGSYDNKRS